MFEEVPCIIDMTGTSVSVRICVSIAYKKTLLYHIYIAVPGNRENITNVVMNRAFKVVEENIIRLESVGVCPRHALPAVPTM